MNHSFLSAGSVFNSVYTSDKHSAWAETQPHFMIQGPDPCGYIWISSRAAGKLIEICRGQSGGRLGAWNRGGQTWTGYNTAIISVSLGKCTCLDFEADWSSHSVAFPRTQVWGQSQGPCEDPASPPHPNSTLKSQILHMTLPSVSFWTIPRRSLLSMQLMAGNINVQPNTPLKQAVFQRGLTEPRNPPSHLPSLAGSSILSSHFLFLVHQSSHPPIALLNVFN